jgi:diguanylate cyclase (GGDEF)-like protein/PAS domain S-box-containing protein
MSTATTPPPAARAVPIPQPPADTQPSTEPQPRARRAWLALLGFGGVMLALYLFVPPLKGSGPVMNLLGLLPVIAIVAGVRIFKPEHTAPWHCFAAGFLLFWLGDLYTYSYPLLTTNEEVPFPSIGDGFYLAVYPVLMAGLWMLVRRRSGGRDVGGLVDAAILTVGLALPSWIALIAPYVHDHSLSPFARLVSVAYPLGDVLLLAVALRLALDGGRRSAAFHLMIGSIVCLLMTDFVYGLMILHGTYDHQLWLDAGWICFYVLWGAAALHPSMRTLTRPADREAVLTRFRLGLLTTASLIAPTLGLANDLHNGDVDMAVVRTASLILFGLVIVRMAGLMRQQERMLERERVFTKAGLALVAATSRKEIDGVAVSAALDLVGPGNVALLCRVDANDDVTVDSCAGTGRLGLTERLPREVAAPLLTAAQDDAVAALAPGALTALGGQAPLNDRAFAIAVAIDRPDRALLIVAGPSRLAQSLQPSLHALASEVALALETVTLTAEVHRRQGEARLGSLVRHANDLITVVGRDGVITYQSPSIERLLGYKPDEVTGSRFYELVTPSDRTRLQEVLDEDAAVRGRPQAVECTLTHRDGTARHFEILHTNLLDDEHVGGIVLNCRDVSERRAFEEQLTHQAFHDPVTKLANRALFGERVRHALARARREDRVIAVVFMDLDDFKMINDSLGHAAGDEVLLEVAKRLEASLRTSDTAARFGGDEFALLLEDSKDLAEAADIAERVLETLALPMTIGHTELTLRASIGIAIADGTSDAEELIRDADAAMYIAKRDGKGAYRVFEPEMHEGVLERLELRADLQRALATEQLELHYQPVVRLRDGSISGVEALLRWRHPERGLIAPDQFIPLAEETGLIVPIGRWVLREGCRQARRMLDALPEGNSPTMSINLSLKQLQASDLVSDVRDALTEARLDPGTLTLEITETVLMADADVAVKRLNELKELGVHLALDDFGTGYSSLSYLSRFPVDILKMDRSFLRPDATPGTSELATAVVGLGASLNLDVVAEGIELAEQWETLRDLGCRLGQGFFFARPMDADATMQHLMAHFGEQMASRADAA